MSFTARYTCDNCGMEWYDEDKAINCECDCGGCVYCCFCENKEVKND